MNIEYMKELYKRNKIGKIIKLINDNVRIWSVRDYNDIFYETNNNFHIMKYFTIINDNNIIDMERCLKYHSMFFEEYGYHRNRKNGYKISPYEPHPIYAIVDHNVINYRIVVMIAKPEIAKYIFSHKCMNKFDIIENEIIKVLTTCITFNFYDFENDNYNNNANISISDYKFLEFYYPGIIDKVMEK